VGEGIADRMILGEGTLGEMTTFKGTARGTLWLTAPIVLLLFIAAGSGILFGARLYTGVQPNILAQGLGQDLFSLLVALPGLVISAVFAGRGSLRARVVWLGILGYLIYTYAFLAFNVHFNILFLVYTALLGGSLYTFLGGVFSANNEKVIPADLQDHTEKFVSIFLAAAMALFYINWLSEIVPALWLGDVPRPVRNLGVPAYAIHVVDMAFLLPAFGISAWGLWRGKTWGVLTAGILLILILTLSGEVLTLSAAERLAGFPVPAGRFVLYAILLAIDAILSIRLLKRIPEDLPHP
jgi:hypothetical protein